MHEKTVLLKEKSLGIGKMENLADRIGSFEKDYILRVLEINDGNRKKTARVLEVSLRSLYYKLEKYGIKQVQ